MKKEHGLSQELQDSTERAICVKRSSPNISQELEIISIQELAYIHIIWGDDLRCFKYLLSKYDLVSKMLM